MNSLRGQVALITGSSRGIGRATALRLAREGVSIVVNYLKNKLEAEKTVSELHNLGVDAVAVQADTSKPDEIKRLFAEVKNHFNRLDIFVSNAAKGVFGAITRIGSNGFDLTMATGPKALLLGAQEAVKLFGEKGGVIVAVSSIGNIRCLEGYSAMGAAKAALETVVRYLAAELGSKKIRVNAVSGGAIDTEALKDFKNQDEMKREWIARTPLGRLGTAEDIADIIAFLCSDQSRWIHGQTIIADGGGTLR
jgi:NAD(P)-dependent dehydrogenase (short-subunit alcohol dehydrogenase family)